VRADVREEPARTRIDLTLGSAAGAERARLLLLARLVMQQAVLRDDLPPAALEVSVFDSDAARRRRDPVAACSLRSESWFECGAAPAERLQR
jgi:hypothetical protein